MCSCQFSNPRSAFHFNSETLTTGWILHKILPMMKMPIWIFWDFHDLMLNLEYMLWFKSIGSTWHPCFWKIHFSTLISLIWKLWWPLQKPNLDLRWILSSRHSPTTFGCFIKDTWDDVSFHSNWSIHIVPMSSHWISMTRGQIFWRLRPFQKTLEFYNWKYRWVQFMFGIIPLGQYRRTRTDTGSLPWQKREVPLFGNIQHSVRFTATFCKSEPHCTAGFSAGFVHLSSVCPYIFCQEIGTLF